MDTLLLIVTAASLATAVVSCTVAWRVTQAERRRQAARVATLASAAGVANAAAPAAAAPASAAAAGPIATADGADVLVHERFLGADASASGSAGRQHRVLAAAAAVAAVVVGGGFWTLINGRAATPAAAASAPLELVSLSHARTDGVLSVSGLVRNPARAAGVHGLEAEVRVFDAAGILIATKSAPVEAPLAPGQEAPFVVALGEAATAARYRVSFRSGGTMRHHVDRRTHAPAAVDRTAEAR
jgi:hypothetical protein